MTLFPSSHPPSSDVFGPYSLWPRQRPLTRRTLLTAIAGLGLFALFVHCVLPSALAL